MSHQQYYTVDNTRGETTLASAVYQKPTLIGHYARWDSISPKPQRINLIRCLVDRTIRNLSRNVLNDELVILRELCAANSFLEYVACQEGDTEYTCASTTDIWSKNVPSIPETTVDWQCPIF